MKTMIEENYQKLLRETVALAEQFELCASMQLIYAERWGTIDEKLTPEQKVPLEAAVQRVIAAGVLVK